MEGYLIRIYKVGFNGEKFLATDISLIDKLLISSNSKIISGSELFLGIYDY